MPAAPTASPPAPPAKAFFAGWRAAWTSVFSLVLIGTYVGIGALAHDYGFSLPWVLVSTLLVWAGPAQVILLSALGAGATPVAAALAGGLSGMRLQARRHPLRLLPTLPRAERLAFANGVAAPTSIFRTSSVPLEIPASSLRRQQ